MGQLMAEHVDEFGDDGVSVRGMECLRIDKDHSQFVDIS